VLSMLVICGEARGLTESACIGAYPTLRRRAARSIGAKAVRIQGT
jgi:hypothetical protein